VTIQHHQACLRNSGVWRFWPGEPKFLLTHGTQLGNIEGLPTGSRKEAMALSDDFICPSWLRGMPVSYTA